MKQILYHLIWILGFQLIFSGCGLFDDEDFALAAPPTASEAAFTYSPSAENDNIIEFTNSSAAFIKQWDFGNGTKAQGSKVTGVFPLKGTYEVTLTIYTSGGSVSSTQLIEIAETDPTLLDLPIYNMLTGGADDPDGKTWIIDASRAGHFGVGPVAEFSPIWYAAGPNEKAGAGLYNDKYTFKLNGFGYLMNTEGDVFVNTQQASSFPGAYENAGDYTAPFTAPANLSWSMAGIEDPRPTLTISPGGFIGYFTGTRTYQIISLTENEMVLRYLDAANADLAWYLRLIPEGYTPPPPSVNLPITFDAGQPLFNTFGGSSYEVIDNPHATGINTSAKVLKTEHGGETWAGLFVELASPLDLSSKNKLKLKVWAPQTGTFRIKLENTSDSQDFVEIDQEVAVAEQWVELTFDLSSVPSGRYARLVIFPGWGVANAGTFYVDDLRQVAEEAQLSVQALTGGSAKSWKLKPAAGSFGVGPARGSDAWWPNGADISGDRPCLFNDEFIFKTGGVYEYDANGDLYGEPFMGVDPGSCIEESALPANAQAWGSGTHSFTFTPATDNSPAYITVTGTGAYIALAKAYNGGEYASGPPTANASVKYEVISYVKNSTSETLSIAVDISAAQDGSSFWNFVLTAE